MWLIVILIISFFWSFLIPEPKYDCNNCEDTGEIEVLVMGTDTDYVPCICKSRNKVIRKRKLESILSK